MIRRLQLSTLFTLLAFLVMAPSSLATTFVPMADADLAAGATLIVEGRILAAEKPAGAAARPAVDYRLAVERTLQGSFPGEEILVRVPGGVRDDGIGLKIWGAPTFRPGDPALLFLDPIAEGVFTPHQFLLGAFHVGQADGRAVAWRELDGAHAVSPPGKSARPAPRDGVRDLEDFRRYLEARASGSTAVVDYFLDDLAPPRPPPAKFALLTSPTAPPPLGCGQAGGRAVRWFDFDEGTTVPWRIHLTGQRGLPGGGTAELEASIAAWNGDPHTEIGYLFLGETVAPAGLTAPDGRNTLLFEDPNGEIAGTFDPREGGVLALGGPWFTCQLRRFRDRRFHPILEGDVVTQDGLFSFFALFEDPSPAARELFAHELGHTLGFAHTPQSDALMFAEIHADGRGAAHHADDLAAALFLYGDPTAGLAAPAAPGALTAEAADADQVRLEWVDRADDESSLRIERRLRGGDPGDFVLVTTVPADSTQFIDTTTAALTTYVYRVRAQNGAGTSPPSAVAVVTTPEDQRPAAPTHLWSAALSSDKVRLTWQDNSDDESAFLIEIQLQEGFIEIPVAVPPDTRSVVISGLTAATPFTFRLRARNAFGVSAPTNRATSWTFPTGVDCEATANRLCLAGGRLAVEVQFRIPRIPLSSAAAVPATDEMGFFWFFQSDNVELMTRAVEEDDGSLRFGLAGLTSLEYRVTVTDTRTGESREIVHLPGSFCHPGGSLTFPAAPGTSSSQDSKRAPAAVAAVSPHRLGVQVVASPFAAGKAGGECETGENTLCLRGGRFATEVTWKNPGLDGIPLPAIAAAGPPGVAFFAFRDVSQPEMVLKLLDGADFNGHYWVIADSPAGLDLALSVVDVATGRERVYFHASEDCPVADMFAFPADP